MPISAKRVTREIKLAASPRQANVVALFVAGDTDGTPQYVMPFVDELPRRARLKRDGALPMSEATSALRDMTLALVYAREHGIVGLAGPLAHRFHSGRQDRRVADHGARDFILYFLT